MKVIVIDDDLAFLRSLELVLALNGHDVRCFDDPLEAYSEMRAEPPEAVLVDLVLPGLSGFELLERLSREGATPSCVVLISGHSDLVDQRDLARTGVSAFLAKPVDLKRLMAVLSQYEKLEGSAQSSPARQWRKRVRP